MPIHTLMFGWEYPPLHCGGLGVACQGLVRGLLHHGVQVTLVLPHPHANPDPGLDVRHPTEEIRKMLPVRSFLHPYDTVASYAERIQEIPREMGPLYGQDLPAAVHLFTEAAVETTKNIQPDIIHCHDWMTYGAGMRAASFHRKPLIAHIHATELDRTYFHPDEWIYERERQGFIAADRIIAVSNYTRDILIHHYGIPPEKIAVVHNGSSEEPTNGAMTHITSEHLRKKAHPLVLFLGRLTIQKGPWYFLEMAVKVHALRADVQFVVAGDGSMLPELINRACELHLEDCVVFAGKVSQQEARNLYAQADCFVMPSLSEPFGLVALEAIAHGAPIILSKQAGVGEVVGHAFKVDFWDTDKMADCVLTILREQPLAEQLRSEATRVLQHLTWQNQATVVKSIYEQLLCS